MPRPLLLVLALVVSAMLGVFVAAWGILGSVHAARHQDADWARVSLLLGPVIVAAGLVWALAHSCLAVWVAVAHRRHEPLTPAAAASAGLAAGLLLLLLVVQPLGPAELSTLLLPVGASALVMLASLSVVVDASVREPNGTHGRPAPAPRH